MAEPTDGVLPTMAIPTDWTVEQAEAVLKFLAALEHVVWETYGNRLIAAATRAAVSPHPLHYDPADRIDDDIPF